MIDHLRQEDAGLNIFGVLLDDLAPELRCARADCTRILVFVSFFGGSGGFDIEAFALAYFILETYSGCQSPAGIALSCAVVERLGLVESPVTHGALRIDADALFES